MPTISFQSSFFSTHHADGVDHRAYVPSALARQVRVDVPL